jgi:hypothetical protein
MVKAGKRKVPIAAIHQLVACIDGAHGSHTFLQDRPRKVTVAYGYIYDYDDCNRKGRQRRQHQLRVP